MERSSCLTAYWLLAVSIPPSLVPSLCVVFATEIGQAPWDSSPPSAKQCYARDVAKCKHRHGSARCHSWAPASPQDLPDQSPTDSPSWLLLPFCLFCNDDTYFSVFVNVTSYWMNSRKWNWTLKGSTLLRFCVQAGKLPPKLSWQCTPPQTTHEGIYFPTAFQPLLIL